MYKYYLIAVLSVVITIVSQLLLKKGSSDRKKITDLFLNVYSILGMILFLVVTLLMLLVLRNIELKELIFITPLAYILVPLFSFILFKEKVTKQKLKSLAVIMLGIFVFNLDKIL